MKSFSRFCLLFAVVVSASVRLSGQDLDPVLQTKIDAVIKQAQSWAADPVVVKAVKAHNTSLPADSAAMTQDKWKTLSILDPFVRAFSKNEAGQFLKSKKTEVIAEAFLSGADGLKVAFLSKPSGWSHAGKPKNDVPLSGKIWQGPIEVDESIGLQLIQVSVPVLDGGKSIGSLVVGISIAKLAKE